MLWKRKTGIYLTITSLVATMGLAATAWAKKPDKPPPEPPVTGTIYLSIGGVVHSMDADGGNKTALNVPRGASGFGILSRQKHGPDGGEQHYWFLQLREIAGETYPDGRLRHELFAVRDDGDANVPYVQLTFDANLIMDRQAALAWGIDDTQVSWVAMRWVDGSPVPEDAGIYKAGVVFDAITGNVVGLSENEPPLLLVSGEVLTGYPGQYYPDIRDHDWSPDGDKIVYSCSKPLLNENRLFIVADLGNPDALPLQLTFSRSYEPQWSPDGSKIAYLGGPSLRNGTLVTINPDPGNSDQTILFANTSPKADGLGVPYWSPDSTHLVFLCRYWWTQRGNPGKGGAQPDVYRVTADGEGLKDLTKDTDELVYPLGWR